jgi:hypothetical protein
MLVRRWCLWFVMAALVVAPALGLMHRIVHGPQVAIGHELAAHQPQAHADDCDHGPGWAASLFSAHDDASSCRLFDQLSHSDVLAGVPALILPLVLTLFLFRRFQRDAVARWAALFDARGPPALR